MTVRHDANDDDYNDDDDNDDDDKLADSCHSDC